jgi:hypothetical protein
MTPSEQAELYAHPGWEWCTAAGARKQVLLQGLRSTLREKLEWLEEAESLTLRLQASRSRLSNGPQSVYQDMSPAP